MNLKINKDTNLKFSIYKNKKNKQMLYLNLTTKYINFENRVDIKREDIISIIEGIERILLVNRNVEYRTYDKDVVLGNVTFSFYNFASDLYIEIQLSDKEKYEMILDRKFVILLYNYLTKKIGTLNKIKSFNLNKKYTFVKVNYIEKNPNKLYSYICEDDTVNVNDIVYVDMAGKKVLAVVKEKDSYYYEETPYPLLETKRVISIVTRATDYIN